jgi:hypothetical protein
MGVLGNNGSGTLSLKNLTLLGFRGTSVSQAAQGLVVEAQFKTTMDAARVTRKNAETQAKQAFEAAVKTAREVLKAAMKA